MKIQIYIDLTSHTHITKQIKQTKYSAVVYTQFLLPSETLDSSYKEILGINNPRNVTLIYVSQVQVLYDLTKSHLKQLTFGSPDT